MLVEHQIREAKRTLAALDDGSRANRMMERDIIIVWGLYLGWPDKLTAKTAHVHRATISRSDSFHVCQLPRRQVGGVCIDLYPPILSAFM